MSFLDRIPERASDLPAIRPVGALREHALAEAAAADAREQAEAAAAEQRRQEAACAQLARALVWLDSRWGDPAARPAPIRYERTTQRPEVTWDDVSFTLAHGHYPHYGGALAGVIEGCRACGAPASVSHSLASLADLGRYLRAYPDGPEVYCGRCRPY